MAYMRGDFYVWSSGDEMHITRGEDSVVMPIDLFEDLCAMHWARLSADEKAIVEARAAERWFGNFGCDDLRSKLGLPEAMADLKRVAELRQQGSSWEGDPWT